MRDEAFASNGGKKKKMTLTQKGKPVQRNLQNLLMQVFFFHYSTYFFSSYFPFIIIYNYYLYPLEIKVNRIIWDSNLIKSIN